MIPQNIPVALLAERASEAALTLKLLAHEQRLLLLCRMSEGECSVGELVELSGLSQSGVSQHLARMRDGGIVKNRRQGTTIYYSIADDVVQALIGALCERYGPETIQG